MLKPVEIKQIIDIESKIKITDVPLITLEDMFREMGHGSYYIRTPISVLKDGTVIAGNQSIVKEA